MTNLTSAKKTVLNANATKKNTTSLTIKTLIIITGEEPVTPCKPIEKASAYHVSDADEEDRVDGAKITSKTKELKDNVTNAKNKASTVKKKGSNE